ncbi:hypothetical protein BH11BAC3_BH11BAC3_22520 [soil metagenome]
MASIGANGFPYIKHRGRARGFLKVLNDNQIASIDFKGNMQYITVSNLATANKALFWKGVSLSTPIKLSCGSMRERPEYFFHQIKQLGMFFPEQFGPFKEVG